VPSQLQNVYLHCTGPMQFTVSHCAENLFWHPHEQTCSAEPLPADLLRQGTSGACAAQPCKNGAECQDNGNGAYVCVCKMGFTGQNCETQIDMCASNPCHNGGLCLSYAGGYSCICQDKVIDGK